MAVYIKGDPVANATSYTLFEKNGSDYTNLAEASNINFEVSALRLVAGNHTLVVKAKANGYADSDYSNEVEYVVEAAEAFRTKGSFNLFEMENVSAIPKVNATTLTGWSTALGQVPSSFPIAGVRLAVHPSNGNSTTPAEKCTKIKAALFTVDTAKMKFNSASTTEQKGIRDKDYALVAEKVVDVDLAMDTTHLVDVVFDTPYVNTDNKFLLLVYVADTVLAKHINNSGTNKNWQIVNNIEEDTKYTSGDSFYTWYFNNTILSVDWAQFKATAGGETYSIAYTLFNKAPV